MQPSRVLLVDQTPRFWGGQAILSAAARTYRAAGWTVEVLAPGGGELEDRLRREHGEAVAFHPLRMPEMGSGRKNAGDLLRLLALTARFGRWRGLLLAADLVHVNGPRLWLPVHRVLPRSGGPALLLHVHLVHSPLEQRLLGHILARRPRARAACVSPFVHRRLTASRDPGLADRVIELENALGEEPPPFENRFADEALRRIAIPGRIGPEKGQLLVAEVARTLPGLDFLVIGAADPAHGDHEALLRRRAPANVRFAGRVADVPATLARERIQAVVVPSEWEEPFGLVAIEAMAASCLTLVRDRGGLADIARRTGAPTFRDAEGLEARLRELAGAEPGRLAEAAAAQHRATAAAYDPDRWRRQLLGVAGRLLAEPR